MIRPPDVVDVTPGPMLLSGIADGPSLAAHRVRQGPLPEADAGALLAVLAPLAVRGRGGAGFPLARKIDTVLAHRSRRPGRRPVVVVNAAEGEPASAKDSALLDVAPHLVLDGAVLAARALGAGTVHLVTSVDRPWAGAAAARAVAERDDHGIRWSRHEAQARFVSGQARAVLELFSGRSGLPVTSWVPESMSGHRGRPTLLSNAESFAHLAAAVHVGADRYASYGTPQEPGTTLLTLTEPAGPDGSFGGSSGGSGRAGVDGVPVVGVRVVEVCHGDAASQVLSAQALANPVLVGGFHGAWLSPRDVPALRWSNAHLRALGASLGAGCVITLARGQCPVEETARIVTYLAAESAGRCGPCFNGLPALADEVRGLAEGADTRRRIAELTGLVRGRGACAHPDGTARIVTSLLTTLDGEVEEHLDGRCGCRALSTVGAA